MALARRLFQDDPKNANQEECVDDNSVNLLVEHLQKSSEEAKKKWNFDFVNEKPLEGDWEWEKVDETKNEGL